ncbi:MAG TPA: AAA family ATPase [Thermodesulfobacteriota bacterium]|nr:AAA family ATPase [Thermodesulfobacteriota bacterium]
MYSRMISPPKAKSFFLFGPRGTGKTTWVKSAFPEAAYIDLLEAELFNDLTANPQRLSNFVPPGFKEWVIIDEVQRIPELLHEVHRLIETKKYRFILTGSSPRRLKRRGPNLLAGRALTLSMHPLSVAELGNDFRLDHSLRYGQLPSVYTEADPKKYLEAYVRTYLEEEIRQEGLTRNLSAFARFLEATSFSQGSVLSISSVARECHVERKVVESYFSILEDLLIGYRMPILSKKAKRRLIVHPKFYFFDVGVYRTLRPMGPLDAPEEVDGIALETLFLQELIALNSALDLGYKIFYWRTSNGKEVDFVLYGPKGLLSFEIKRTSRITSTMLGGLKSFLADYPMAKAYFVYGGNRRMYEGKIEIVPVLETLKNLKTLLA